MKKKKNNKNSINRTIRVTQKTAEDLQVLAAMGNMKSPGRIVDKLVRAKMRYLKRTKEHDNY